MGEEKGKR